MSIQVYQEDILQDWVNICLADGAYPIEVTIKIHKNGRFEIEQVLDGRRLRNRFTIWMVNQFFKKTNIKPPKNKTSAAFNKTWVTPLETILRQAVYTGGVDYDKLKPKDKYTALHGICFNLLLSETVEKQRAAGLTIAQPTSIVKIGTDIASTGTHYRSAVMRYEAELSKQHA
jgi:hypothetical protein